RAPLPAGSTAWRCPPPPTVPGSPRPSGTGSSAVAPAPGSRPAQEPPPRLHRGSFSCVRRGDRLSPNRQAAWDRLADRYVLDLPRGQHDTLPAPEASLDLELTFGRRAELVVEIGSGLGEKIAAAAAADLTRDHLAVAVHARGSALYLYTTCGRRAEVLVEIGNGLRENIAAAAAADPTRDHLAVEVYAPGIAQTLLRLERAGLPDNVRILPLDAQASLPALLP